MKKSKTAYCLAFFLVTFICMGVGRIVLKAAHLGDGWLPFALLCGMSGFVSMLVANRLSN
ncbi:hypothetical protein [Trinickia dinghuensis]|uniref:Uncharacterized protein n=1 Tax=Trinickia dinghuensis TaxID=2291023 RepID=A0A3D8JYM9_9BURK|nr:hypothetical protein [Trinickia dinghuensis]RDU97734.1 hypothetical protein DWV00_17880 [Trinickia dinghuensis]